MKYPLLKVIPYVMLWKPPKKSGITHKLKRQKTFIWQRTLAEAKLENKKIVNIVS